MMPNRSIRLAVALLMMIALSIAIPPASHADDSAAPLEGSWVVSIVGGNGTPLLPAWYRAFVTFSRNGGLVATITDATISTGHGAWRRTGNRTFAISILLNQFDSEGAFLGTLKARSKLTVNRRGDAFTGDPYEFAFFDPQGHATDFIGIGIAHGVRIVAEPLP
jgi:hypothetical protein